MCAGLRTGKCVGLRVGKSNRNQRSNPREASLLGSRNGSGSCLLAFSGVVLSLLSLGFAFFSRF